MTTVAGSLAFGATVVATLWAARLALMTAVVAITLVVEALALVTTRHWWPRVLVVALLALILALDRLAIP